MGTQSPVPLAVGDVVELRKPHPCGGKTWRVLRVGADIGAECLTCRHYMIMPRRRFEGQIKQFVSHAEEAPAPNYRD